MEVRRFDYEKDLNEAVALFNKSFSHEITNEYFNWKHKDNPFGESYGLVAVEDNKIVGLRMFMKWKFSSGSRTLNAIRPVDTCTDPNYRGKGIFRTLTLQGLEEFKGEYDFVFNTPNSNSINGYLKMGWKKTEKSFYYNLGFVHPFSIKKEFQILDLDQLDDDILPSCNNEYATQLSHSYLKWRYKNLKYKVAHFQDGTIVVFRLEKIRGAKVLVLLEFCGVDEEISGYLNLLALRQGIFFIYYLRNENIRNKEVLLSIKRGRQNVVVKDNEGINVNHFNFSAGDLEGVL